MDGGWGVLLETTVKVRPPCNPAHDPAQLVSSHRLGHGVAEEAEDDAAEGLPVHGDVEVRLVRDLLGVGRAVCGVWDNERSRAR